ncbi:MAG TPA: hypothetical protein VF895_11600 [Gaiellaceae bacterium]
MFVKASSATSAKHSAHYALDLTVSIETNGALKNALVQAFAAIRSSSTSRETPPRRLSRLTAASR